MVLFDAEEPVTVNDTFARETIPVPLKYVRVLLVNDVLFVPPRTIGKVPEVIWDASIAICVLETFDTLPHASVVITGRYEDEPYIPALPVLANDAIFDPSKYVI